MAKTPSTWPADKVERRQVSSLLPYARNARTHSEAQVAQIAASITEWGWTVPVLIDEAGTIIAGHGRILAAQKLGLADVPVMVAAGWSDAKKRAYVLADNKLAMNAGWDDELLALELGELKDEGFDLDLIGFGDDELAKLLADPTDENVDDGDPDEIPAPPPAPVSMTGDVWLLGRHRAMCGDSTSATDLAILAGESRAPLLHADPPYGMGKEADGVANDNLYAEKLDAFQMEWWSLWRTYLADNASAYIWGNAPDLWRLWYVGGLGASETLEFRNEIVWDKNDVAGMASPLLTQYPVASERCLFFQVGNQFRGSINSEDFPSTWEPLRAHLEDEAKAAGIKAQDIKRICGCSMYGHWFTRSQFTLIPESHYKKLAAACEGRFLRPWRELKAEWDRVKGGPTSEIQGARSYFDNAHEPMRDVWNFRRVIGEERHGHATPKPIDMMRRIMVSSAPKGGLVLEPFGGSGATLIGAHVTGRICYTMEMQPIYVDVIVRRWETLTGQQATLEGDGRTFAEIAAERVKKAA